MGSRNRTKLDVSEPAPELIMLLAHRLLACDLSNFLGRVGDERISSDHPRMLRMSYRILYYPENHRDRVYRDEGIKAAWAVYRLLKERGLKDKEGKDI